MPITADANGLQRERLITVASLVIVAALAWLYLYLWVDAGQMEAMVGVGPEPHWSLVSLSLTFVMWSVMMIGMMLPSAVPAILLYSAMVRRNREPGAMLPSAWIFAAGYIAVWTVFSLAATILQAGLQAGRLLTPMEESASLWLSAGLLVAAGVYQWLPFKDACLEKCREPLQFFLFRWRPGTAGAFAMGAEHGLVCVGCCWALMLLLFMAGAMNLLWVAVIAAFVFVEKLLPAGRLLGKAAGIALVVGGAGVAMSMG